MQPVTLALTYAAASSEQLDLLQIEQQAWGDTVGAVSKAELALTLHDTLYGGEHASLTECGIKDGAVTCIIDAYPRVPGLAYQLNASHGTLTGGSRGLIEIEELLDYTLTTEARPQHPPRTILSAAWAGDCYDVEGAVVPSPFLTIEGDSIMAAEPVYGSATVRYLSERHRYTLDCPRRGDALDNHYSAVVYGVYEGGINWLVIEMPPNIDAYEADPLVECGWGTASGSVEWPEDQPIQPVDRNHARHTVVDYCNQRVISDTVD